MSAEYAALAQQLVALTSDLEAKAYLQFCADHVADPADRVAQLRQCVAQIRERAAKEQRAAADQVEKAAADRQRKAAEERALFGLPAPVESPEAEFRRRFPGPVPAAQPPSSPRRVVTPEAKARAKKLWRQGALRAAWTPRRRGKANEEVQPVFTMFPKYVNAPVRAAMSKSTLLAYLACLDEADLDGRFEMPAGRLGTLIGMNRRNAQIALYTLVDAGLVYVFLGGGPKTPNVYGLTPFRDFDEARAIAALDQHRQARLPALRALREKQGAAAIAS